MKGTSTDRESYYAKVAETGELSPLWTTRLVPPLPEDHIRAVPHLWDYDNAIREILFESASLITAQEANRRVLTLENPGLDQSHRIAESLYAGLQLILPGEVAPPHRHTPSALRFILEGEGAYTTVSGEKSPMLPGDFIITPSMTWHEHGHEGDAPVVWMDGLDIPMVGLLGPMFFENYPEEHYPNARPTGDSLMRYGANMRPTTEGWDKIESPIFHYPYARSREALFKLAENSETDPAVGAQLEYINPLDGGSAMPTISTFLQRLPGGFEGAAFRTTENIIYSPVEGAGRAHIGDPGNELVLEWKSRDIFVVPCWVPHRLEADDESVLFSFSDRVVQKKLGLWRWERIEAGNGTS